MRTETGNLGGNDPWTIVMKFATETWVLECATIPRHRDNGSVESDSTDCFVESSASTRNFDDNVGTAIISERANLSGDMTARLKRDFCAKSLGESSSLGNPIDPDDPSAEPSK